MPIIIVSDIFGKTAALVRLCQALGGDTDIVDPYAGKSMNFQDEEQAYERFNAHMGLDHYSRLLQSRLSQRSSPTTLIGFSVGASAIWQISESFSTEKVKCAVCFYGSQVRHMWEINPNVPIEFVLPKYEPGFSVGELKSRLAGKKHVAIHQTPYLHGFMNELSRNYHEAGYIQYLDWLNRRVVYLGKVCTEIDPG